MYIYTPGNSRGRLPLICHKLLRALPTTRHELLTSSLLTCCTHTPGNGGGRRRLRQKHSKGFGSLVHRTHQARLLRLCAYPGCIRIFM